MAAYFVLFRVAGIPEHVVERFRRGEREAFVEVYRAWAPLLRRWVARFFKSPFEQEEAVQEVWLVAHRQSHRGLIDLSAGRGWFWRVGGGRFSDRQKAGNIRAFFSCGSAHRLPSVGESAPATTWRA